MTDETRTCNECGDTHPLTIEFYTSTANQQGRRYFARTCKECNNRAARALAKWKSNRPNAGPMAQLVTGYGTCPTCHRINQQLQNGQCCACRQYRPRGG